MSIAGFIVLGDRTSHGGTVVTGDPTWTINGQPVARVGDKVTCPRCNCVSTIATSRFSTITGMGKPAAYDQDTTACGAVLYSRHNDHAGWGSVARSSDVSEAPVHAESVLQRPALKFQEHFVLHDNETGKPMARVPYVIKTGDGKTYEGETDDHGRTDIVWTDSPKPIEVLTNCQPAVGDDPYHYAENDYGSI